MNRLSVKPEILAQFCFQALKANKLRSFLTMLGIIIGVAAVIVMTAIGHGTQEQVLSRINQLGADRLTVMPGGGGQFGRGNPQATKLTMSDAEDIAKLSSVKAVAPVVRLGILVTRANYSSETSITGTTPDIAQISSLVIQEGRFISEQDVKSMRPVAVLGQTAYENLFPAGANPIGAEIRMQGVAFKVVGLLASVGAQEMTDQDDVIYVPITTAQIRLLGTQDRINSLIIQAQSPQATEQAQTEITALLRKAHGLTDSDTDDFRVINNAQIQEQAESVTGILTLFLAAVAGISLVVGGIGIMNIMLVSVTERTREIGIRKAIGASREDILAQFLLEAVLMCFTGSLVGIILGAGTTKVFTWIVGWPTSISLSSVILAIVTACAIGIFFGYYPARHASSLDPVQALISP